MEAATSNGPLVVDRSIPIIGIVAETYRYLGRHWPRLAVPLGLLSALNFGWSEYLRFIAPTRNQTISTGLFGIIDPTALFSRHSLHVGTLLPNLVVVAIVLAYIVSLHRFVILDERPSLIGFFQWRRAVLRYAWTGLLVSLLYILVLAVTAIPVFFALYLVGIRQFPDIPLAWRTIALWLYFEVFLIVPALFLMGYLLALPAAALDVRRPIKFSRPAGLTYWLDMAGLFVLIALPFWTVSLIAQIALAIRTDSHSATSGVLARLWMWINDIIWAILDSIEITLAAVALSLVYRRLLTSSDRFGAATPMTSL